MQADLVEFLDVHRVTTAQATADRLIAPPPVSRTAAVGSLESASSAIGWSGPGPQQRRTRPAHAPGRLRRGPATSGNPARRTALSNRGTDRPPARNREIGDPPQPNLMHRSDISVGERRVRSTTSLVVQAWIVERDSGHRVSAESRKRPNRQNHSSHDVVQRNRAPGCH